MSAGYEGRIPALVAFQPNKRLLVSVNDGAVEEIALVDVAVVTESYVGARAVWRPETLRELFAVFADPEVIGRAALECLARFLLEKDVRLVGVRVGDLPRVRRRPRR